MNKKSIGLCLLLLLLLIAVGCGGGGGSRSSTTSTTATTATTSGNTGGSISVTITPTLANVVPGGTRTFTATVANTGNQNVIWSATGGSIAAGVWTAPDTNGTYTIRATSAADQSKFAEATVNVGPAGDIVVTVTPSQTSLGLGQSRKFTASVAGTEDQSVTWEASSGTISSTGFYTAPKTAGVYTVTARSQVDSSVTGTATVTVSGAGINVLITPQNPALGTRESIDFTATVTNASDKTVTWSASDGTITSDGHYTAPDNPGTYTVTATSNQDPSVSASAQVTVTAIGVSITPTSVTLTRGGTQQFTAAVTNARDKTVSWSASGGTVDSNGFYTAPDTVGTYTVTATSNADNRQSASATVTVVNAFSVFYDFESGVPGAWIPTNVNETAPGGQKFLGRLSGSDTATLTLSGLTTHTRLRVTFDLYVIGDWENENLQVNADSTQQFLKGFSNATGVKQTYPDGNLNAPGFASTAQDTLNYPYNGTATLTYKDTTYHIVLDFPHTTSGVTLKWLASLTRAKADQAWGLDNVRVEAIP